MTADDFRRLALDFPGARESSHMNHPDFRAGGKIFSTLGSPNDGCGMVKLTPQQQQAWLEQASEAFKPASGAWGKQGSTLVHLASAKVDQVRVALEQAWRNTAAKKASPPRGKWRAIS